MYFSAGKVHIFVTPFSYSTLLTGGIEKWNSGDTGEKIPCFVHECQTFPLQLQENIFLSMVATRHLYRSLDTVCIQFSVTSW
jgi:hypothetical protein